MKWTTFWFDGNLGFGMMEKPEDWERIKKAYAETSPYINLIEAKENPDTVRGVPSFGFYWEYTGKRTLGEWAKEQGMKL